MPPLAQKTPPTATTASGAAARVWSWRREPEDSIVGVLLVLVSILAIGSVPALVPCAALALVSPTLWRVDVTERRLPNVLVYPCGLLALGAVSMTAASDGGRALTAVLAAGATLVFFAVLTVGGGMGMGDLKLAVVLTAVLGLVGSDAVVLAALVAFVSGGVGGLVAYLRARTSSIPFGPFLLVGFWVAVVCAR